MEMARLDIISMSIRFLELRVDYSIDRNSGFELVETVLELFPSAELGKPFEIVAFATILEKKPKYEGC